MFYSGPFTQSQVESVCLGTLTASTNLLGVYPRVLSLRSKGTTAWRYHDGGCEHFQENQAEFHHCFSLNMA
jgi:hypothetical protein